MENIKFCADESGVPEDYPRRIGMGDLTLNDEKSQCFVKCFFQKFGFSNENGEPQADLIVQKLGNSGRKIKVKSGESLEELIGKCVLLKGENECETAYNVFKCYKEQTEYIR
jgi:hypothetical protein